jgi:lipopolysaccharide cholinephosphotransferase
LIQLDNDELRKLQLTELELLIEFDRVCRKNHIRYTLTGGTLLGAVRHGGFIPWDDDADVSMLRVEYEKFRKACETDLGDSYYFQDMKNTHGYRWGYGKLRKRNTLFLREHQEHMPYEQGVFIDVFPRDGVPDNAMERKLHKFQCFCVRKTLWSEVGKVAHDKWHMRAWFRFLSWLAGNRIFGIYDRLVEKSNRKKTKLVRNLTFPVPGGRDGYLREWYDESTELEFEGHRFMVNKAYRKWLEQEFGDYLTLPSVEKRKVHPVVKIILEDGAISEGAIL